MLFLKLITVEHVMAHAGIDLCQALGLRPAAARPHWRLATPIARADDAITATRFYGSIDEYVDDDDKRASFALLMNGLGRAAHQQDYQAVLKDSNVAVKVAHLFEFESSKHKVWELKQNKKDRLYFCAITIRSWPTTDPFLVPLLVHHKKDQTTPREVSNYCERTMKSYLDRKAIVRLCKE